MSHIILENVSINFPIRETISRTSRVEKVQKLIGGRLSNSQRSININALDNQFVGILRNTLRKLHCC